MDDDDEARHNYQIIAISMPLEKNSAFLIAGDFPTMLYLLKRESVAPKNMPLSINCRIVLDDNKNEIVAQGINVEFAPSIEINSPLVRPSIYTKQY